MRPLVLGEVSKVAMEGLGSIERVTKGEAAKVTAKNSKDLELEF